MKLLTSKQAAESWADGRPMARAPPDWATRQRTDRRPRGSYVKKRTKKKEKWPVEAARVLFVGWPAVNLHVKSESQLTGRALPSKY